MTKENLHRDYIPYKGKEHIKGFLAGGIIVKLRFKKNISLYKHLPMWLRPNKDVFYWLPYKKIVDSTEKYSVVGPASRFPFAKCWFEVRDTSEIYEVGLSNFILQAKRIYKHTNEMRTALPFLNSELLTVTRKKVIKMLDEYLFTKTIQQQKVRIYYRKHK